VKRLLAAYQRATGRKDPPGVTAGGTYAKVIPNAIVFGMWFPGNPYPGHDVDEKISLADLHLARTRCSKPSRTSRAARR
jgi:succinyl-diaminopimelate desuccinylase